MAMTTEEFADWLGGLGAQGVTVGPNWYAPNPPRASVPLDPLYTLATDPEIAFFDDAATAHGLTLTTGVSGTSLWARVSHPAGSELLFVRYRR